MSGKFLCLNWNDIDHACDMIAQTIMTDKVKFDSIICAGRGGMIPSRILSDKLDIPEVHFVNAKAYSGIGKRDQVFVSSSIGPLSKQKVLIVDDILDSGVTLEAINQKVIQSKLPQDQPLYTRTATLCWKNVQPLKPSYYHYDIEKDVWVVFPWEKCETKKELGREIC
jgi:hypoxanthine phosphoribosyltransferase